MWVRRIFVSLWVQLSLLEAFKISKDDTSQSHGTKGVSGPSFVKFEFQICLWIFSLRLYIYFSNFYVSHMLGRFINHWTPRGCLRCWVEIEYLEFICLWSSYVFVWSPKLIYLKYVCLCLECKIILSKFICLCFSWVHML